MAMTIDAASIRENRACQDEEMEALHSIYGEDCKIHKEYRSLEVLVYPSSEDTWPELVLKLRVYFPETYPSESEPIAEILASWLSEETRQQILCDLRGIFREGFGDVVIFKWVEWLKGQDWLWQSAKAWASRSRTEMTFEKHKGVDTSDGIFIESSLQLQEHASAVSSHAGKDVKKKNIMDLVQSSGANFGGDINDKGLDELDKILGIFHGVSFSEKKSTFQAHLAPVKSVDQVETVMETLMRNRKVAAATHNIMAYRISIPEKRTVLQDYDDDGETAAGGRMLHLLQIVDALDVVVIVSRWFGGILLGPDRFKHINNAARSLLSVCGYIKGPGMSIIGQVSQKKNANKKVKKK